jgi:hypothetical protein
MPLAKSPNAKRLVFLVWLLVAVFYFYLSYDYVRVTTHDREFGEYLHRVVQIAGIQQRPAKEIRTLLLVKAEQLALPVRTEHIAIAGGGESLSVIVKYDVDIEIPVIQSEVYTKRFEHKEKFRGPW